MEPENRRRGGWSSVVRVELDGIPCYLKRQHRHRYLNKLLLPRPTLYREYCSLSILHNLGIAAAELLYYADNNMDAVMVLQALDNHRDLNQYLSETTSESSRQDTLSQLVQVLLMMHKNKLVHGCLYGNHILLKPTEVTMDIRLLDLEKMKRPVRWQAGVTRDLDQLFRHTPLLSTQECELVLQAYRSSFPWFSQAWSKRQG